MKTATCAVGRTSVKLTDERAALSLPLDWLDFTKENDDLLDQIMVAIEQAPEFLKIKEE